MRHRTAIPTAAVVAGALLLSACTSPAPDAAPSSPPAAESPSPAPSSTYAEPGISPEDISYLVYDPARDVVENTMQAEAAADVDFAISGQCEGDAVDFQVLKAAPGETSGDVLVEGTLECATGVVDGFSYRTPYTGALQIALGDTSDIDAAWLAVRPAS